MKACNACKLDVINSQHFCPLCGEALEDHALHPQEGPAASPLAAAPANPYPNLQETAAQYNLVLRLLMFLSILGTAISVLINLLVPTGFLWCLIVAAAVVYLWLSIPPLLRRNANYGARVVFQVIFTSALVIALDFIIGYNGWSLAYVVPGLLCAGIVSIGVMIIFNRTNWAQYVMYQVVMGIFGFVPLLLHLLGVSSNLVMVLITAGMALSSLLVTFIFGDRSIKSEFKKRFHF